MINVVVGQVLKLYLCKHFVNGIKWQEGFGCR
jgi:hypothetical protein